MKTQPFIFSRAIRTMKHRLAPWFRRPDLNPNQHEPFSKPYSRWGLWILTVFSGLAGATLGLMNHQSFKLDLSSASLSSQSKEPLKSFAAPASLPACREVQSRDLNDLNRSDDDVLKDWHKIHAGQVIVQAWNCRFDDTHTVVLNHQSPTGKYVFVESWPVNENSKNQAWKWKMKKFNETSKMHLFSDSHSLMVAPQDKTIDKNQQAFYRSSKEPHFYDIEYSLKNSSPHVVIHRLTGLDKSQVNSVVLWMSNLYF